MEVSPLAQVAPLSPTVTTLPVAELIERVGCTEQVPVIAKSAVPTEAESSVSSKFTSTDAGTVKTVLVAV